MLHHSLYWHPYIMLKMGIQPCLLWGREDTSVFIVLFDYIGNMEMSEMETGSSAHEKSRVLGVIVLTDNRQHLPSLKHPPPSIRCSAFTQPQQPTKSEYEEEVFRLVQRVSALEQRIYELSHMEAVTQGCRQASSLKKKQRRKLKDIIRDQQCPICQKTYGSETSLKYHLKLKHANNDENHSQSN